MSLFALDNFALISLLVTDGRIAPTAAAAEATFPSTAAAYHSDAIRHSRRVVEGQLEYIGEAVSAGAATCSAESSMSVSKCVCTRCLVLVFMGSVSTERVCSHYVLHADPVADEAFLQVSSMVDNEVLH